MRRPISMRCTHLLSISWLGLFLCHQGCLDSGPLDREYLEVRQELSLNGTWEVAQGELSDTAPESYPHTVPVPALITAADPPFAEVGKNSDLREAFWYRKTFPGPDEQEFAILKVHKAKYGIKVWLNDQLVGEHLGSYTLAHIDVADALRFGEPNTLTIRVGDYLDSVPGHVPAGQDGEKEYWIPGIYDDVAIVTSGSPHIVRVKVEPDIDNSIALVKTTLVNNEQKKVSAWVESQVLTWAGQEIASPLEVVEVKLAPGEQLTVEQTLPVEDARLWSPEDPFLYLVRTAVRKRGAVVDNLQTRFGMRKVEWRGGEQYDGRFYLNDELYYLRGSNITLHRFFEDQLAGTLPWNEEWVRKLLSTYPKQLHWNSFRICVGRAPNFWYDIADEVGFLLADEFMMWTLTGGEAGRWSVDELAAEFAEWIQESWNHPSIAWWDASNETYDDKSTQAISRVRDLDPTRQWENGGFNPPHRPGDPIEDHPYLFTLIPGHNDIAKLDQNDGCPPQGGLIPGTELGTCDDPAHPYIINEYGWLWINRDGTPTTLSAVAYNDLLGEGPHDPEVYREAYAYLEAGLTEFWRARRRYAGVLHFTYLGYSRSDGETSDNFVDIENLVLEPRWVEYARYAFSPLMVYIDSWRDEYPAGQTSSIPVVIINDLATAQPATLRLMTVTMDGEISTRSDPVPIDVAAHGTVSKEIPIQIPPAQQYLIFAELKPQDESQQTVWSRRKIGFENIGQIGPDPPIE